MKLVLIVLFGIVGVCSQSCIPAYQVDSLYWRSSGQYGFQTIPCSGRINGTIVAGDKENCDQLPNCCIHGDECVVATPYGQQNNEISLISEIEKENLYKDALEKSIRLLDAESQLRGWRFVRVPLNFPPAFREACISSSRPFPFLDDCRPTRNEPYVFESAPINIPYCLRIPCTDPINSTHEKSQRACGMQPGCYFDEALAEYRSAFGHSILPGVPVCHLVIRNKFFHVKAQTVVKKYGSWNPYFTYCNLKKHHGEISRGPNGCELLSILEAFHLTPKLAGWTNINRYECALIDGCWRFRRGCFYPVDINTVRTESRQRPIVFRSKEIIYGRPKCQHFDISSPLNILKSYHRCLSAGCTVDSSVTNIYFSLLYSVGLKLTVTQHWKYWDDVERGLVGVFNLEKIGKYGTFTIPDTIYTPETTPDRPTPATTDLLPFSPHPQACEGPPCSCSDAHAQAHKPRSSVLISPQFSPRQSPRKKSPKCCHPLEDYMPSKRVDPCGSALGGRPCAPPVFQLPRSNCYCPYKRILIPRFLELKGSFAGCCDINLCYLPKSEIFKAHSGPSHYYSEWSLFSDCSASCGGGMQTRFRNCISYEQMLCTEALEETKPCNTQKCCGWSDWGHWTPCSKTCGAGVIRTRRRRCLPADCHCTGSDKEVNFCNLDPCQGHGGGGDDDDIF